MTPEKITARLAQLEAMVEARRAALDRMAGLTPSHLSRARSVAQAFLAQGSDVTQSPTLAQDADALVQQSHDQAEGLHGRLKKVMGIKNR
jgi:septation ring formation regulator EzrA